jgi:hypothetical protein
MMPFSEADSKKISDPFPLHVGEKPPVSEILHFAPFLGNGSTYMSRRAKEASRAAYAIQCPSGDSAG